MLTLSAVKKWTPAKKRAAAIGGLSLLHGMVCWGAFAIAYSNTMTRFETGRLPNQFESMIQDVFDTLSYPFMQLATRGPAPWFQGFFGIVPFVLTSALWGTGLYFGILGLKHSWHHVRRRRQPRVRGYY
jgi:hypothetical protein